MSDSGDNGKYKWTPESTSLLVSVWTDKQVQKQLAYSVKPQLIWESVARYMRKKGYEVTAKQCRSRMKQVLICYREAKRSGTRSGIERYYDSIDRVLESKKNGKNDNNNDGTDVVDSAASTRIIKSPAKEIKTNVNLRMRGNNFQEPVKPLLRRIHVTPEGWKIAHHEEYGDSSESNETVLARPRSSMSPVRDVGTNTGTETLQMAVKSSRRSLPDQHQYRYDIIENNRFSEIPKNTVQNVQNQIIQENMILRNQLGQEYIGIPGQQQQQPTDYRVNIGHTVLREPIYNSTYQQQQQQQPVRMSSNCARMQSQLQQCALNQNPTIIPQQESKKFGMYGNFVDYTNGTNTNYKRSSPSGYSPDLGPNLNEGFYNQQQTVKSPKLKAHNLNETYDRDNEMFQSCINGTTVGMNGTNNATFNDDTLSIDFVQDSLSPSENGRSEEKNDESFIEAPPDIPFRKKKAAQKLELLMINAIASQNEVVNKILAAQDTMVSRLLDREQDRQSRLENRIDQLMTVVHASVLNKSGSSSTKDSDILPLSQQYLPSVPTGPLCFSPPPRPGTVPPKLDLVPPKPCRVPCTSPSANIELINQNPIQTRPGTIAPIKPGSIWTKSGPVSQSPFVKAQQQMASAATDYVNALNDWRTKSSAERRILKNNHLLFDKKTIKFETEQFLLNEKLMEERIENARKNAEQYLKAKNDKDDTDNSVRRELFNKKKIRNDDNNEKEPSAGIILTRTFLDIERKSEEKSRYCPLSLRINKESSDSDDLLTGQGESYERLKRLSCRLPPLKIPKDKGLDTSTPSKNINGINSQYVYNNNNNNDDDQPKQTIHQLAQLVMQSTRWKNAAAENKRLATNEHLQEKPRPQLKYENEAQKEGRSKANEWLQDRYSYAHDAKRMLHEPVAPPRKSHMGFINPNNNNNRDDEQIYQSIDRNVGFKSDVLTTYRRAREHDMLDEERKYYDRQRERVSYPPSNREFVERYSNDNEKREGKYYRRNTADNDNNNNNNDDDDIFLDTTTTMKPYRKTSLTSGNSGVSSKVANCVVS